MSLLWINGQLIDKSEACISPFDHGFLYGDGVWIGLRVFGGRLFQAEMQVQNLVNAATLLAIPIPVPASDLITAIDATVRANHRTDGYVRVIVTRGLGTIGPDPRKLDSQIIIIAEEYQPFPAPLAGHGLHVVTFPDPIDTFLPVSRIATLGQLYLVNARRHALRNGCLDALLLNHDRELIGATEGTLFWSKGDTWIMANHLPDSTAEICRDLLKELGRTISDGPRDRTSLLGADEAFLAGTSCGVIAIIRVDNHDIGSGVEGALTREIRQRYHVRTRGEVG